MYKYCKKERCYVKQRGLTARQVGLIVLIAIAVAGWMERPQPREILIVPAPQAIPK